MRMRIRIRIIYTTGSEACLIGSRFMIFMITTWINMRIISGSCSSFRLETFMQGGIMRVDQQRLLNYSRLAHMRDFWIKDYQVTMDNQNAHRLMEMQREERDRIVDEALVRYINGLRIIGG
jgi:hypothetical protein